MMLLSCMDRGMKRTLPSEFEDEQRLLKFQRYQQEFYPPMNQSGPSGFHGNYFREQNFQPQSYRNDIPYQADIPREIFIPAEDYRRCPERSSGMKSNQKGTCWYEGPCVKEEAEKPETEEGLFSFFPNVVETHRKQVKIHDIAEGNQRLPPLPKNLKGFLTNISIANQNKCGQLDYLLGTNWKELKCNCPYCDISVFSTLTLPKSNKNFKISTKKTRKYHIPDYFYLDGTKYVLDEKRPVRFGGYGGVAFYTKCLQTNRSIVQLPTKIALKVGSVKKSELESVLDFNFDASKSKAHWIREFCVHRRLKLSSRGNPYLSRSPAFASLCGGTLAKVGRSVYSYCAMEAGICDLFELFTRQPISSTATAKQFGLLKIMQSAAEGLEQLHKLQLHHGDVKLANILLHPVLKRAMFMDFDGAVFFDEDTSCDTYTKEYLSPQRRYQGKDYSREADDNWALGVSFLLALTLKKCPVEEMPLPLLRKYDLRGYVQNFLSTIVMPPRMKEALLTIICGLLQPEERCRMTAGQAAEELSKAYQTQS